MPKIIENLENKLIGEAKKQIGQAGYGALNTMFLPVQSIGFLLAGLGIVLMLTTRKSVVLAAPAVWRSVRIRTTAQTPNTGSMSPPFPFYYPSSPCTA